MAITRGWSAASTSAAAPRSGMRVGFVRDGRRRSPRRRARARRRRRSSSHSRCRVEMLRKPATPRCARIVKDFVLALDQALVIEVAMAVDQPHAAASSSSGNSSRGNSGVGCASRKSPSPARVPMPVASKLRSSAATPVNDRAADRARGSAGDRQDRNADVQRAEHRLHALRVGLAQRPGRLRRRHRRCRRTPPGSTLRCPTRSAKRSKCCGHRLRGDAWRPARTSVVGPQWPMNLRKDAAASS